VTGASLGIGRQIALQLALQGARLALAARSEQELSRVASLCRERGGEAIAITTDVSDEAQCKALIERAVAEYGQIDSLINNAGMGMRARFDELSSLSLMETVMRVNFWGSVYCTHYALPHLRATKGRIVVIISGGGKFVTPGACGYGASKHALVGFFDTLRIELAESGVSVTAIYPDWVATGISARSPGADGRPVGNIVAHEQGAMLPEACARLILKAAAKRRREAMSPRHKLGLLFAPIFPGFVDEIAVRAFAEAD
jgi:NAD(P)-dependent dehydrogenase (short-subunit alcohol dehydrogenase family)